MSKLLKQYENLKKENKDTIYLFRVGIFYNIINEDAKIINEQLGLKITDLGPNIYKCGFPVSQLEKYKRIFDEKKIAYTVIDNFPNNSITTNDYLNNIELKKVVNKILEIDFNNTTFQQSFNLLLDIQEKLKNIYK
jgi:DNA mismatch repair ATPase MutS|nr:MAG TPA: MutS domain I [Caudoviricetes sp.]